MNLKFMRRVSERERAIRQFVIVRNKLMSVFLSVCPVIDEALLGGREGGVPMSPVCISQLAMSQFRNILVSPVGISLIIFLLSCQSGNPHSLQPKEHTGSTDI